MNLTNKLLDEVKSLMRNAIVDKSYAERGKFCTSFALISKFAGWKWRFKEILMEDIEYTYNMLTNNCLEYVNKLEEKCLNGKHVIISCSTGRIHFVAVYYVETHSVMVDITADIS